MRLYRKKRRDGTLEPSWYGEWTTAAGKRKRKSLHTPNRAIAQQRLLEHASGNAPAPAQDQTLLAAAEYFLTVACAGRRPATVRFYELKVRQLIAGLGKARLLAELTRDMVLRYYQARAKAVSASTVAKEALTLRQILQAAKKAKQWSGDIAEIVPEYEARYQPKTRFLADESELGRLLAELPEHRHLWVILTVYTAARSSVVPAIEWPHVELDERRITVPETKTASAHRTIPMADALHEWLERASRAARAKRDKERPGDHDKPLAGPLVQRWGNYRRDLAEACTRAKLPPVTSNDLRRTYASWMVQRGVPLFHVARLMGHSTTRMVEQVYGRLADEHLRAAIDKLPSVGPNNIPEPAPKPPAKKRAKKPRKKKRI